MIEFLQKVKKSKSSLLKLTGSEKNNVLLSMAEKLELEIKDILIANEIDMANAMKNDLSSALKDRLFLDDKRVQDMAMP